MNGLDMLNTAPGGVAAGQAVAARAGDAGPDDPGGDPSRSFNALLATFDEPAAEAPAQPIVPGFAPPPSAVLRQALQITSEAAAGNAPAAAVDLSQAAESASPEKKPSTGTDDLALSDLVG